MLPEPDEFGRRFHELFKQPSENQRKRIEWKKLKKRNVKTKDKRKNKLELINDNGLLSPPEIELPGNASAFAVFASVRLAVLERWMRHATQEYLQSSCSVPTHDVSEIDSDTEENSQNSTYLPLRVSKIVGLGLRSVFELIRESRSTHPALCTKALLALLDVLQGQTPEGLRGEPPDVMEPLFELLLDLATLHGPEPAAAACNDGSHLTAVACACLLALVVVRGDTGRYLAAVAALLMAPRALAAQRVPLPAALASLQRSVHGVLLGRATRPDFTTHGVPAAARIDHFAASMPPDVHNAVLTTKSLTSDGHYIYLFSNRGLFKIGSGYGGTIKGHIYIWKPEFYPNDRGWIGYCNNNLYLKLGLRRGTEILTVERQGLHIVGTVSLDPRDFNACVIFSDGDNLGTITPAKDDGFIVRTLNPNVNPASCINELPLKLARKCIDVLGAAAFDEEASAVGAGLALGVGSDEEVACIVAGKEFALLRTGGGRVLWSGRAAALGLKAGIRAGRWTELPLTKAPRVVHVAVGHEGLHALLVADDGAVFFCGTARRGEDGDHSKARRQPKPAKPKKMIKVDGVYVVHAAANHGSTALVTRDGELLMFGKDTAHADPATGVVSALKGEHVTHAALGKAHAVALTTKGHVYTFGINNKYQCGREPAPATGNRPGCDVGHVAMDTCGAGDELDGEEPEPLEDEEDEPGVGGAAASQPERHMMCAPGRHAWRHDLCMVCTVCRECTGYSISCLSSMRPDRNPGQECGCGEGDSGCAVCGCCRICARDSVDNSELAILGPSGAGDLAGMMRLDLIFRVKEGGAGRRLQEQLARRLDERRVRQRKAGPVTAPVKYKTLNPPSKPLNTSKSKEALGSDAEKDAARVVCFPPARLPLSSDSPVVQVACGLHHTVLLTSRGEVFTFGSNQYGQLGCGDILAQAGVTHVKLPCAASHVAAGSNHTAVLTARGEVYTFGNNNKGQLGREAPGTGTEPIPTTATATTSRTHPSNPRTPWYSAPGAVPGVGPRHGRRATWVGAAADQTFLKIDESLINSVSLARSTVIANKNSIVLLPNQMDHSNAFKCLVINKHDGSCNSFSGSEQVNFCGQATCVDPLYNVLWSYNPINHDLTCYNTVASEIQNIASVITADNKILTDIKTFPNEDKNRLVNGFNLQSILSSELALPVVPNCFVTRLQAAVHLLGCLDTLAVAHELRLAAVREETTEPPPPGKAFSRDDFTPVNRFESHGGGWGYSGHSIEAIRFMCDTDVLLGGFGLFGGRGEYTGKIKLLDIGPEGGEQEGDGEVIAETEEIPYECGPRQKYPMLFDEPVPLQAQRWYVAWCRISGPSSDCGSSGQTMVTTEDQVMFYFKSSKKSNNGTDVNAGQIPQLLYRVVTTEVVPPPRAPDAAEPVYILSKEFSRAVSKECFAALLALLQWSWNTFKASCGGDTAPALADLQRLVYVSRASLRLLRAYTNETYPEHVRGRAPLESVALAESVGDVRALLKQILADGKRPASGKVRSSRQHHTYTHMMNGILDECHHTFVACFHAFYPTAYLKWSCLCELLGEDEAGSERLLSAVLSALCGPSVRLRSTFPLLGVGATEQRGLSPSDNTGLPMLAGGDHHHYPVLVEQMSYRSQVEQHNTPNSACPTTWTWRDVLERLLALATAPVRAALSGQRTATGTDLARNCCLLLSRVVAELAHQCSASDDELQGACGRSLHTTPSRFTRTNQSRTWNTGNGSPDAICFQVDRAGIAIAGVAVFAGLGHYEYELELLEDGSSAAADTHGHAQRWNNLETVRGSFGPEDYNPDIMEIKFDRPVPIKENVKYAFRLRNHGGRTSNGDGGLNTVKGPDNTTFTFSTCSLSFNGTTQTRGQIPHILYYSNPADSEAVSGSRALAELAARRATLAAATSIAARCSALLATARERAEDVPAADILAHSCVVNTLLPLVLAHVSPLVTQDPRSGVQVLTLIQDMLPHVAALNLLAGTTGDALETETTSQHYTWVQSDHPYKLATVSNYRVAFPDTVKWLSLEFDSMCGTAQPEDCLQLYVPSPASHRTAVDPDDLDATPMPYWPVLHKFSSCHTQWPQSAVILPGNEVLFSLETASDYLKDDRANTFGFRCLVVGYEWGAGAAGGLRHLEAELAFLGGMCAAGLMKRDLPLGDAAEGDAEIAELVAQQALAQHGALLARGLALTTPPTVTQALDGTLPFSVHSNERLFLRDFVGCVAGSSGGRLAQWLQPASRVDPARCQVLYNRDELRCGWPAIVTVLTRDQYGDLVHVANLRVEVKAVPIDKSECEVGGGRKMRRLSQPDPLTFGGLPAPPLHLPYEPTVRDKMCFHSVTLMKPFQAYSFEELRYASPPVQRSSENMLVRPNADGTYSATWTPASVGCYSVLVTIDGYAMEEAYKVEVREPPQGLTPPTQQLARRPPHQPSKLRKFVARNSAGLRVRAHPSLQSEQIGVVHVNGTIAFVDEIHNDDGVWLRLSADTIKQYCSSAAVEAWCLQYNQHLGKTLLLPVEEPKSILDQVITETILRKLPEIHDRRKTASGQAEGYQVIKCGASGHNVRARPSLKAPPVGMLVLGNHIGVTEYVVNSDGCWVLLDQPTLDKYCFNHDGEAWSLAMGHNNVLYLGTLNDVENDYAVELQPHLPIESISNKRGFDFTTTTLSKDQETPFMFGSGSAGGLGIASSSGADSTSTNPFVFGDVDRPDSPKIARKDKHKNVVLPKWLDGKDREAAELSGVCVKELVKALGESRANGNGVTPPDTPRRSASPRSQRSSSPVAIPAMARVAVPQPSVATGPCVTASGVTGGRSAVNFLQESPSSSPQAYGSSRSIGVSPLVSGTGGGETSGRRGSTQSDTSALVSSLTRDLSQSPSQATGARDLTPSPSPSPSASASASSLEHSPRRLAQTGTQTSPESLRSHFSIGTSGTKEERVSPKLARKERGLAGCKARPKRAISPANLHPALPTTSKLTLPANEPIKQAVSPSVAESLRAVFAAFLWHEGIVHDAMACASFLKFHPTLPKKGALVVTRHGQHSEPAGAVDKRRSELTKEERARQRHSVEVSTATAGNYLHIQPATLETLTRSAANANANRSRTKKLPGAVIKEDIVSSDTSFHTVTVLPPALKSLVFLWEELTGNCLQAITQQAVVSSPSQPKAKKPEKSFTLQPKNDAKDSRESPRERNTTLEKESKKSSRKKKEWKPMSRANYLEDLALAGFLQSTEGETACELCGEAFPHPVTYHMRAAHPGCGAHAGGKGYNSSGNFCVGWAGNCGDGGVAGSSWYLVCDTCRDKYMRAGRGATQRHHGNRSRLSRKKPVFAAPPVKPIVTVALSSPATSIGNVDAHLVMKNNAMFLLELACAAHPGLPAHQRRPSAASMPAVAENQSPPDHGGPFGPPPPFQCLRTLGAAAQRDEPPFYEEVLRRQSFQDNQWPGSHSGQRPLSEVSLSDNETETTRGLRFHRSVSMGTNGVPWARTGQDGRIIMLRKRNNSSCETTNDTGSSLLCNPSATLQKLIPNMDNSAIVSSSADAELHNHETLLSLLQRPVMAFVLQQHDLDALQLAMKQALRKAMCRVYAMQALNWLLRSVTQPVCLHDLLWWFVTSLTPAELDNESDDDNKPPAPRRADEQDLNVCEHPLADISIAGDAVHPLPATFHALLQTIADLMVLLPMGSALQQMAVRCWGLRFTQADHTFLHRSQVFSNISKILSRSEEFEDCSVSMHESHTSLVSQITATVECLRDLTPSVDIKASSRQAMIASLTDGSTETFWESGDEDRNKTKGLTLTCAPHHRPKMVCLHVDNCRDLANKVSSISFFSGPNSDELTKLRTVEVESRLLGGWVNCPILEAQNSVIRVELKGPDNSLRVRQIRVLGEVANESIRVGKLYSAATIQQRNCEAETLRVFRLITSQVFGKLILGDNLNQQLDSSAPEPVEPLEESNDLREHMVGILFSRSKLTHLQKQVIVHIVQALRKEALRVREEWEAILCSAGTGSQSSQHSLDLARTTDTYCFEMLSMVLALSGSSVGRAYLSHQHLLLADLLSLLHTGSARVQRQVTALLRRMLPEITPDALAKVINVAHLPPADFSIVSVANKDTDNVEEFDIYRVGILDVFLSIIAKSLSVQVKVKSKEGNGTGGLKGISTVTLATSIHPRDYIGERWWLRGSVNRKLAEVIIHLLKDMAAGKLSEAWAHVTKGAVAENILNLTRLSEEQRSPSVCLHTATLWLALASLCVLDREHVEQLSSGQWAAPGDAPRPTCSNHDDGETGAIIQCNVCGTLCADCDRFLHLHRRTRLHQRQVCKEEEEAIKVELHEGCGRTKLFWLLALADARTLKALVEFREGGPRAAAAAATSGTCRFCGATGSSGLLAIGNVCADHECQEYARTACTKVHSCGHMCGGVTSESSCLPCLHGCASDAVLRQDADDMCMICFTEALAAAPALQLACGHVFHLHCCRAVLLKRWAGPRITFAFALCPICKADIEHSALAELLVPVRELLGDVRRKALMRLEYEGLHAAEAVTAPGSRWQGDPAGYAMDRYAYYVCYKCGKAYYGGEARCDAELAERYDPTELVCGACSDVARAQMCPKHGTDFLEYKCRYCCSVAVFFCFGTTHFCNPCHDDFQRVTNLPRTELPACPAGPKAKQLDGDECPLHVKHPPTGEEFALGCGVCRNAHTF